MKCNCNIEKESLFGHDELTACKEAKIMIFIKEQLTIV